MGNFSSKLKMPTGSKSLREKRLAANKASHARARQRLLAIVPDPAVVGTTCWAAVKILDAAGKPTGETKRCPNPPIKDQRTCVFHGGHSKNAVTQGLERKSVREAKEALVKLGVITQRDPREVLLEQVYASYGMMEAARQLVEQVNTDELFGEDEGRALTAAARVELYSEWVDRAARVAKMALDAGIDERMVQLAEGQAKAMVDILKFVVLADALGLTGEQQSTALQLLGQQLRTYSPLKLNAGENASEYLGGTVPYEDQRHRHVVGG